MRCLTFLSAKEIHLSWLQRRFLYFRSFRSFHIDPRPLQGPYRLQVAEGLRPPAPPAAPQEEQERPGVRRFLDASEGPPELRREAPKEHPESEELAEAQLRLAYLQMADAIEAERVLRKALRTSIHFLYVYSTTKGTAFGFCFWMVSRRLKECFLETPIVAPCAKPSFQWLQQQTAIIAQGTVEVKSDTKWHEMAQTMEFGGPADSIPFLQGMATLHTLPRGNAF